MDGLQTTIIDIEDLTFDRGAHLILNRALRRIGVGEQLGVRGRDPELRIQLRAWCRAQGHEVALHNAPSSDGSEVMAWIVRGNSLSDRWNGAERAGRSNAQAPDAVCDKPAMRWGLAARGALVEAGSTGFYFPLHRKEEVWADNLSQLYAQALAGQWDPSRAVDWNAAFELPEEIESAVVQLMTYLVENENAALLVPAKFLAGIHPHFRETMQLLAIQVADEARHVEVFTRRASLRGSEPGLSTISGQLSLKTLFDEPDFTLASFLLSVLGEGTFLNLLKFLEQFAPDPITGKIARLAAQDEARHVAFGMGHLQHQITKDPATRHKLAAAIHRRHDVLIHTSGLNEEVFDALVLLAAGSWKPKAIAEGYARVQVLQYDMNEGRRSRLIRLGFSAQEAEALSALHTRNFM